ncbi:hypothetical protein AYL99_06252 [Fonsecaea erecta]|uniref:Nucleoporin NSP1-like C-terminal domain-containing protein n=1 Tax=Fonsecaea erecta TaxID=1367422 RepID=A0A178ZIT1_9EURO|nr:hypothetical protein AYL99_06252 [Fonsecaea erecta]OAP58955.1 hypothetical protein AYL99_06252 [Fonsecaea erecta]
MAFNFGQSSTSGGSAPSLFGTSNTPSSSGGGLFSGAPTSTANTNTNTFTFGGFKPSTTTPAPQQNLFTTGGATNNQPTSSPSIFGQQSGAPGTSAPTNIFGATTASSDATKTTFGGLGGFGTPDKSSTPTTSASSLFGSTTPAPSKGFNFGTTSTTPAGPPPTSSTFGASTGGSSAGMFGAKPAEDVSKPGFLSKPAAAASSTPGSLFGGFGLPKPAESTSTATPSMTAASAPEQKTWTFSVPASNSAVTSAPASSQSTAAPLFGGTLGQGASQNLFGKPATTEAPGSAPKPTFPFSQPSATQASGTATPATSAPAQTPLFGGFSLGGTSSSAPATATATATAPTTTSSLFGAQAAATTSQPANTSAASAGPSLASTTTATQSATTSAPASSLFSFGKTAASSTSQPAATSAPTVGTAAAPTSFSGTVGGQTSTAGPAPPAQSRLRNKTMDEILTRWATDMSRYSKEFKDHAETIARWDQLIVDNSSKIDKLYVRARTCERQTMSVDMQLTAVENSQAELEAWLSKYENDVDEMLAKDSAAPSEMGGPDQERERTYKLAEKLGERLEEMERDLESMVDEVNAANASLSRSGKGDEPVSEDGLILYYFALNGELTSSTQITQIVKILNSHLIQLQAIDQGTQALQEKVAVAQKSASQLGYLGGFRSSTTDGSNNSAAVHDFYRSYMGRRS